MQISIYFDVCFSVRGEKMKAATSTFRQVDASSTDKEVERALRVVYDRFGGDLRVFFQHVRDLQENKEEAEREALAVSETSDKSKNKY